MRRSPRITERGVPHSGDCRSCGGRRDGGDFDPILEHLGTGNRAITHQPFHRKVRGALIESLLEPGAVLEEVLPKPGALAFAIFPCLGEPAVLPIGQDLAVGLSVDVAGGVFQGSRGPLDDPLSGEVLAGPEGIAFPRLLLR